MKDELDLKYQDHAKHITGPCRMPERQGVYCDCYTKCEKCGWNYFVEEKRKEKIKEKMSTNVQ